MTYKILILRNKIPFELNTDCQKAAEYFKTRLPFPITFDFKEVNIPIGIKKYKEVQGFNPVTGQPGTVGYYGLVDSVKDTCRTLVKEGEYQAVIFAWDMDTIPAPTDGAVTSWTMNLPLYPGTEFIQLRVNQYIKNTGKIWEHIIHENMHAFCAPFERKAIRVDEMDLTILPNGQQIPFYKNDNPYAIDGNFAQTLSNLKPYLSQLIPSPTPPTTPNYFKTQEFVSKEIYEKWGENSKWFVDKRLWDLMNFTRTFFGKPVAINNWLWGGNLNERGFRENPISAKMSQHCYGRGVDFNVVGLTSKQVIDTVFTNSTAFMDAGLTTIEDINFTPNHVHFDIRWTGENKIKIVSS